MKGKIIIPIIIGSVLLITGSIIFGVGVANASKNNKEVIKEYEVGEYSKINIDLNIADLEFVPTTDGTRKVVCVEREKIYHTVSVENNTLNIKGLNSRQWYETMFNFDWKALRVTVYAPSETYSEAKIESDTGDVIIPDAYTFNDLTLKLSTGNANVKSDVTNNAYIETSTGNISLEMDTKNIQVKSSTGNVIMNKSKVEEKAIISASTGNINLNEITAKDFELKASTGNLRLTDVISDNNLIIKTSTGDIHFTNCDASTLIDVETSTGDVKGTFLTGKMFNVKSKTGRVNVPSSVSGATCKVKTDTGDIILSIA